MRYSQPAVLSGHTKNLPLSDVVDILRHRHQSGRLVVEYPRQHCILHFEKGELVDARMGGVRGVSALTQIEGQPDAPFTFGPSAAPPDFSIDSASRELALRALGCWQDAAVFNPEPLAAAPATADAIPQTTYARARRKISEAYGHLLKSYRTLPDARRTPDYRRRAVIYIAVLVAALIGASGVMLAWRPSGEPAASPSEIGNTSPVPQPSAPLPALLPSSAHTSVEVTPQTTDSMNQIAPPVITDDDLAGNISPQREQVKQPRVTQTYRRESEAFAVIEPTTTRQPSAVRAESSLPSGNFSSPVRAATSTPRTTATATPADVTVTIVTRIENGRVVQAQVANPRPGMEAFEASALRAARQRRYPAGTTGSDQMRIKISKQ